MFNFIKKMLCRHEWEWEQSLLGEEFKVRAPSGASHYDGEEYWQYHNDKWWVYSHYYKFWEESKPTINDLVSIV